MDTSVNFQWARRITLADYDGTIWQKKLYEAVFFYSDGPEPVITSTREPCLRERMLAVTIRRTPRPVDTVWGGQPSIPARKTIP